MKMIWTTEKIEILKSLYSTTDAKTIAEKLGCTDRAVYLKAFKLGLKGRDPKTTMLGRYLKFSDSDIQFIKENYNKGPKYCAEKLGKNYSGLQKVAQRLGLKSNPTEVFNSNPELLEKLRIHAKKVLAPFCKELLTEEEKYTIVELYEDGLSSNEIAAKFTCSKGPILAALKKIEKRGGADYSHAKCRHQFGEKNSCWKGGIKSIYDRIRDLNSYWSWYTQIKTRDNNSCRICGSNEDLQVHHIITLKTLVLEYCNKINKLPKELTEEDLNNSHFYNISNGTCLCEGCHKEWHKKHGR